MVYRKGCGHTGHIRISCECGCGEILFGIRCNGHAGTIGSVNRTIFHITDFCDRTAGCRCGYGAESGDGYDAVLRYQPAEDAHADKKRSRLIFERNIKNGKLHNM